MYLAHHRNTKLRLVKQKLAGIGFATVVFLSFMSSVSTLEALAIGIFAFFLVDFLNELGKKVIIMDLTLVMGALTCLVMPVIFYHNYSRENKLALIWGKYMPVTSDNYFMFVIPAMVALAFGMKITLYKSKVNTTPASYTANAQEVLARKPTLGLILIGVGLVSSVLDFLAPESLRQVFYSIDHLTFVGVFYVMYAPLKNKKLIVPAVFVLMFAQSIITGMFGEMISISACSIVLILLGKKISFQRKAWLAVIGVVIIILIQSVKAEYRTRTWMQQGSGADPIFYAQLITEKITNPSEILQPDALFYGAVRMNQGWLVGMTMKRVPERFDFAYGETIAEAVAAAIVPRLLWPDKPEAGGRANLKRFWGVDLVGYSMNIGPLGEAYANFDKWGGVAYMFFYGLFFNMVLTLILRFSERRPTIVLWIPFLFFYTINMETDLLTTMGALVKGLIFTWLVFKFFHIAFRIDL